MKLNKHFIVHNTGSETILVPTGEAGFAGIVRGNKTFEAILDLLKDETCEQDIIVYFQKRFNASTDVIISDVQKALSELRKIGALDEE